MDRNSMSKYSFLLVAAMVVLVIGCLSATVLTISTIASYPVLIKEAYSNPLQKVEIPGEADLELPQKGAYGLYYETAYGPIGNPPELDCSLISKTTGDDIPLVPDYVPTNRYSTKNDDQVGVLVYSTTIKKPGLHTLSCEHSDVRESPESILAIGPNYFFEFLRVAWKLGGSLLGVAGILVGSIAFSIGIVGFALFQSRRNQQIDEGVDD